MRRFRWVRGVVAFALVAALVGVVPSGASALPARSRCRPTAVVTNANGTVSTIDVKTRTKHPDDIPVVPGLVPREPEAAAFGSVGAVAVTPDGKTAVVTNIVTGSVSMLDLKTRTKHPSDIPVGLRPFGVAVTPDGKTAVVTNAVSNSVSTIDLKTRSKHPSDIPFGGGTFGVAITPNGKTAFVTSNSGGTVSTIDVKTRTKHPTDIPVGANPKGVAVTADGKTAVVTNANPPRTSLVPPENEPSGDSMSTIDVKTRTKHPTDIPVGPLPLRVGLTPDGKTAFVTTSASNSVATIDLKTRTKHPTDIPVGEGPLEVAVTPCRR
jgi:YVTN family beta-propeller protein